MLSDLSYSTRLSFDETASPEKSQNLPRKMVKISLRGLDDRGEGVVLLQASERLHSAVDTMQEGMFAGAF